MGPQWHKTQRWVKSGQSDESGRGRFDWLCSTCRKKKMTIINRPPTSSLNLVCCSAELCLLRLSQVSANLILRETPWGTPMLTVAAKTLWRLILRSAPYSTTVPKNPVLLDTKTTSYQGRLFTSIKLRLGNKLNIYNIYIFFFI